MDKDKETKKAKPAAPPKVKPQAAETQIRTEEAPSLGIPMRDLKKNLGCGG